MTDTAGVAATRRDLGLSEGAMVVGWVGAVEWRKGVDLFIRLAKRVLELNQGTRDISFLWVGAANDPFCADAVGYDLRALGIADRVRFIGPSADPMPLLAAMDVFVHPSRSDPFPVSCLEAGALAKPVICFDVSGTRQLLSDDPELVIPYPDVDAMVHRVMQLLENAAERTRIGTGLATKVRERYLASVVAPLLLNQIEQVLAARRI